MVYAEKTFLEDCEGCMVTGGSWIGFETGIYLNDCEKMSGSRHDLWQGVSAFREEVEVSEKTFDSYYSTICKPRI